MTTPVPCPRLNPGLSLVCSITDHLLLSPGPGRGLLSQGTHHGTEKGREADHTWTGGQAVCWRQPGTRGAHGGAPQLGAPGVGGSQHLCPIRAPTPTCQPADTCLHRHSHQLPGHTVGSMLSSLASGGSRGSSGPCGSHPRHALVSLVIF